MTRPGATALAAWLSVLGCAALCAVALAGWLDPAHAQAWMALLALCR
ncbi:hypothetical protein VSR17_12065 [Cupriavidus taiwanensis]|nr:hypothetical protein [Cupriavidus taiwanensis]